MSKIFTIEDSKKKSSRSKADLFEVLVTIELSQYYGLDTASLKKEKDQLEHEISKFRNGNRRTEEQYKRTKILIPLLAEKLDTEMVSIYGKPSEIKWIGRKWQEEPTLSDLELTFDSGFSMGISLKSTRQGFGTQKNIGYEKLKQLLGLNIDKELLEMWKMVRKDLFNCGGELAKISAKNQGEIKKAKYRFSIIQKIGKKYGTPVQGLAIDKSVKLFNALPKNKKLIFLEEIFGIKSARPMLNVLVEREEPQLYWNEVMENLINGELTAEKIKNKSYCILANRRSLVRLQASFTNGIGLSAFCERAFLFKI